ncbi:hypothetical protein NBRC116587_34520 [Pseudoteredinibacter isoporae]
MFVFERGLLVAPEATLGADLVFVFGFLGLLLLDLGTALGALLLVFAS